MTLEVRVHVRVLEPLKILYGECLPEVIRMVKDGFVGDPTKQMVYYQAGIGTYNIPQIATPLYSNISKTFDMMFASNMDHHIMGRYAFLMENCEEFSSHLLVTLLIFFHTIR